MKYPFILFNSILIFLLSINSLNAQTGNVGIGTLTPDTTLHIVGNIKIEDGNQDTSKVLMSDASGVASWQTYLEKDPKINVDSLNIIPRWNGSSLVNGTILDNGTNVGIGILFPNEKLEVAGDIMVNNVTIGRGSSNNTSNTVVGLSALSNNVEGLGNTAMGDQALEFTDANFNTGFGYRALRLTSGGTQNTALGPALGSNVSGGNNIGIGFQALNNANSSNNTSVGTFSLRDLTSGNSNVAFGYFTLENNLTGNNNTALGVRAGQNNLGSGNVLLGFEAGKDEVGSDKLYIENSDTATPLIYGDFVNDTVKIYGTLNVANNYSLPINDGSNGQFLTTDGNGVASWITNMENDPEINVDSLNIVPRWNGSNLVNGIILDNGTNVGIGIMSPEEKLDVAGDIRVNAVTIGRGPSNISSNTVVGISALSNNVGGIGNTAMGYQSLESINDNFNTGFGYRALRLTTVGAQNTALGFALNNNISGSNNVGLGYQALTTVNAANNTGVGTFALRDLTSGNSNVALGYLTLENNLTGNNNTALGVKAGQNNLGSGNVFLGFEAGKDEVGSNKLYIDNSDTTDPLIYGDFDTDALYIHGTIGISETLKLSPLSTAPTCGSGDAGLIYFDDSLKKLRVCDGTSWQNMH